MRWSTAPCTSIISTRCSQAESESSTRRSRNGTRQTMSLAKERFCPGGPVVDCSCTRASPDRSSASTRSRPPGKPATNQRRSSSTMNESAKMSLNVGSCLALNKRKRERQRVGAIVQSEVGVAGPEANPAHSEAQCRAGYGAFMPAEVSRDGQDVLRDIGYRRCAKCARKRVRFRPASCVVPTLETALSLGTNAPATMPPVQRHP